MSSSADAEVTDTTKWELCPGCRTAVYRVRLERNLRVCTECGAHQPLTAHQRIDGLFDAYEILDTVIPDADPLGFADLKPYPLRRRQARERTGLNEAVVCATGTVEGHAMIAAVMDFRFMGGSLGRAVGEAITLAGELSLRTRTPLLIVTASGGARMQEGVLSLMQMAKTSQVLGELDKAGVLTISLVTDPTFGGVAASFATLTDVIMAEPGARLGFAGPRVIEQTIGQPLPPGFQTAEFLFGNGLIDLVCQRAELTPTLGRLLAAVERPQPIVTTDVTATDPEALAENEPWRMVQHARDVTRPTTMDYIARISTDFQELHGDRLAKDCRAIVGGIGRLEGVPVMLIGTRKGHTAAELSAHDFGMGSPAGYRKAARLMRMAGKLGLPVVTLIDTPGAHPGLEAEQNGQAFAIADNLRLMAGLPVPSVAVVIGEGGSGGALALAVADRVLMLSGAVYSVISPEGCAAILWNDTKRTAAAAAALRVDARQLLRLGVVDGVIPEPDGGAQRDHDTAAERLRAAILAALADLSDSPAAVRGAARRARFRRF